MKLLALLLIAVIFASAVRPQEKTRVYIASNSSWRVHSSPTADGAGQEVRGESEARDIEAARNFSEACKAVTITMDSTKATFIVEISRRTMNVLAERLPRTEIAVYLANGDLFWGGSKGSLGSAVKSACEAIKKSPTTK